jgi:hypothetical protein
LILAQFGEHKYEYLVRFGSTACRVGGRPSDGGRGKLS